MTLDTLPLIRVYPPTSDWCGLGYKHWLIALTNPRDGIPRSGKGSSFLAAAIDYVTAWGRDGLE